MLLSWSYIYGITFCKINFIDIGIWFKQQNCIKNTIEYKFWGHKFSIKAGSILRLPLVWCFYTWILRFLSLFREIERQKIRQFQKIHLTIDWFINLFYSSALLCILRIFSISFFEFRIHNKYVHCLIFSSVISFGSSIYALLYFYTFPKFPYINTKNNRTTCGIFA